MKENPLEEQLTKFKDHDVGEKPGRSNRNLESNVSRIKAPTKEMSFHIYRVAKIKNTEKMEFPRGTTGLTASLEQWDAGSIPNVAQWLGSDPWPINSICHGVAQKKKEKETIGCSMEFPCGAVS